MPKLKFNIYMNRFFAREFFLFFNLNFYGTNLAYKNRIKNTARSFALTIIVMMLIIYS